MASMYEVGDTWAIQFVGVDRRRKTVRLPARSNKKDALTWRVRIEALLSARMAGCSPEREVSAWIGSLPDASREKLEKVGLVEPHEGKAPAPTIAAFVAGYVAKRSHQRPNTVINLRRAETMLMAFVGPDKRLDQFGKADASDWWHSMLRDGYAVATASRVLKRAKQFFAAAVEEELIAKNPFAAIKAPKQTNPARLHTIPADIVRKVIDAATDESFGLLIAFSRFGGVRVPSELVGLRWEDIDRERGRFLVRSPKKKDTRTVPLFPELADYLPDYFPEGRIFPGVREDSNLGERLSNTIERAGVPQWPRLWQNMRASRQTELAAEYPLADVCRWLGNTPAVAQDHYLSALDESFERAARTGAAKCAAFALQNARQTTADHERPRQTESSQTLEEERVGLILSAVVRRCHSVHVPPRGIEHLS